MSALRYVVALALAVSVFTGCDKNKPDSGKKTGKLSANIVPMSNSERAADFDQLLQLFKTYYGPYQLKESRLGLSIEGLAADLKAKALNSKNDDEFMGYVMQFGAALQDGHVQFSIENSSSGVARYTIPVVMTFIEGKAIVGDIDATLSDFSGISAGDEILSVDGKTPDEIMNTVLKYRRTARSLSDQAFLSSALFSRRFYMTDLLPTQPQAEIKFKNADGAVTVTNVPWTVQKFSAGLDKIQKPTSGLNMTVGYMNEFNAQLTDSHVGQMGANDPFFKTPAVVKKYKFVSVYPSDAARKKFGLTADQKPPIYSALYKFGGKTILLTRIATYSPSDYKGSVYMKTYAALMSEYQDIADVLVLDQTHNPGGSYCASFYNLFAREGDVQSVERLRTDRKWINDLYVTYPNEIPPEFPWDTKMLLAWGSMVEKAQERGDYLSEPIPLFADSAYAKPMDYTWDKPMLVLIDELAGSCGDMFPMLVKANKRAKLFGQNTMGLGGNVEEVGMLNNSRIHIAMTRGVFFPYHADGNYPPEEVIENNGVAPDIEYAHTVDDFRNGYVDYVKKFSEKAIEEVK